jgi:N-acetyl-gamma-glutamylphosphate reductase
MQEVKNFESNLKNFAKNSDVIFLCYPNNNFKKLEKFKYKKNILIIDLWNFLKIKNNKVNLKKVGIS